MKKHYFLFIFVVLGTNIAFANTITMNAAKEVAENFYKQNSKIPISSAILAFTETSANGMPVYFAFNINTDDGFVIVSAEDAGHAIIGYSTKMKYMQPAEHSNISSWLLSRKNEIEFIRDNNLSPDAAIVKEWADYKNNQKALNPNVNTMSVPPLVQTTWNQSPNYNALCPGGSVTGCVATAMAQIMRFWSYPAMGTGSSSYCDCTSGGFSNQFGTLSANYGTASYNWANMPLSISSANSDVALINSHCGISVEMDYDPNGSGAQVLNYGGTSPCAQNSYTNYFGYDPSTIQGKEKTNFSDAQWISLLKNDLDIGRPIQYAGYEAGGGGHTWVCDGYDATDNFHMNWGWGGYNNGFFAINALNPGSYAFNDGNEALIGIQPIPSIPLDAGVAVVNSPSGIYCTGTFSPSVKIKNFGANLLNSCTINYKVDNNSVVTQPWNGSLASGLSVNVTLGSVTASAGVHTLTCYTSSPNGGTDGNAANNQSVSSFTVSISGVALPLVEGLESSMSLPSGWSLGNPDGDAAWTVSTTVSKSGSHSICFDNCGGNGTNDMTGTKDRFYTESYNLSSGTSALTFDVAYTQASVQGVVYSDTLVVFSSSDCGSTWNEIYHKGGAVLATAPVFIQTSACWSGPTNASQWRNETVNLASLAGQPNVMLAFENRSSWGNWIFIDNINISTSITTGISSANADGGFEIYPNPAHDNLTVKASQNISSIEIVNMLGQTVISIGQTNESSKQVDINTLNAGVYFVKVTTSDSQKLIKLIKK